MEGMCAWPEAEVGGAVPVGLIVARLSAPPGKVGDLVMMKACRGNDSRGGQVLSGIAFLRRQAGASFPDPTAERGFWFRAQAVERNVIRIQRQATLEIVLPIPLE